MARRVETGLGSWAALVLLLVSSSVVLGLEWTKVRISVTRTSHTLPFFSIADGRKVFRLFFGTTHGLHSTARWFLFGILDTRLRCWGHVLSGYTRSFET